ncbi:MAG: tyrosine-type recombinase/integrase [Promethearchaeota archaeon]
MSGPKTVQETIADFLRNLTAAHTVQAYATPLRHFRSYLVERGVDVKRDPPTALTVDHAIDFVPWLRHVCFPEPDRPAKATLQLYLTAIYRFYRSLLKRGVTFEAADIARLEETYRDARNIRGERRPKDPKLEAVQAIIRAARSVPPVSGDKPKDQKRDLARRRDIAIVETLRSTGCRVGELVAMRRGDLDWLAQSALVKGKGTKYRKVYFDDRAWAALKAYLQARQDGSDARALARLPVFCGHGNRSGRTPSPLTTRQVSRIVSDLAKRADVAEVGVTPHYFRHVFATRALERTENLALVQDMLGHASPATTRVYARTDETQRREGYRRVWGEMEHSVDAFAGQESHFEAALSLVRAVRAQDDQQAGKREGGKRSRLMRAAMIELLWSTGCTLDELVTLRLDDLDLESRRVCYALGGDVRFAHLTDRAWRALAAYLQVRGTPSTDALFVEEDKEPLTSGRAFSTLKEAASEIGLDAEGFPSTLFRDLFLRRARDTTDGLGLA